MERQATRLTLNRKSAKIVPKVKNYSVKGAAIWHMILNLREMI